MATIEVSQETKDLLDNRIIEWLRKKIEEPEFFVNALVNGYHISHDQFLKMLLEQQNDKK